MKRARSASPPPPCSVRSRLANGAVPLSPPLVTLPPTLLDRVMRASLASEGIRILRSGERVQHEPAALTVAPPVSKAELRAIAQAAELRAEANTYAIVQTAADAAGQAGRLQAYAVRLERLASAQAPPTSRGLRNLLTELRVMSRSLAKHTATINTLASTERALSIVIMDTATGWHPLEATTAESLTHHSAMSFLTRRADRTAIQLSRLREKCARLALKARIWRRTAEPLVFDRLTCSTEPSSSIRANIDGQQFITLMLILQFVRDFDFIATLDAAESLWGCA